ncbi:MAG: LamG domain-containing protein [Verrucomicrobiae bacterium]|nr:LamG domain-containing protein [Verrucomicrobiae bacterium]
MIGPAPAWQRSALSISSNNGTLSVSVAATNVSRFFRLAGVPAPAVTGSYLSNGLVAYWKLNDGAGTVAPDFTGNGNTLSLAGFPTWGSNYLTLDGSTQYGDAGSNALRALDQHDKTICAWIKKNGNSQKGIVDKSFNTPGVANGGWGFWIQNNGKLMWTVQDGLEFYDAGFVSVNTNIWTFVTVVWRYSAGSAEFYIDGLLNSIANNGAPVERSSDMADLQVGDLRNHSSGGTYAFDGSLRQVGIYNRALTVAEIRTNFLATEFTTNVTYPSILYYKLTEHAQTNPPVYLADSSTHGGTTGTVTTATDLPWVGNQGGIPEAAMHFNGVSTYIDTGNANLFNFTTNSFTINLWLLPLTENGFVLANGFYHGNGWFMSVGDSYQINVGAETFGAEQVLTTTAPVPGWPTMYAMVTITRDGTNVPLIYINGALVATSGSFVNPGSSGDSLVVGVSKISANNLDGDLGLLQIWNIALSSSDVANLYINQLSGNPWP